MGYPYIFSNKIYFCRIEKSCTPNTKMFSHSVQVVQLFLKIASNIQIDHCYTYLNNTYSLSTITVSRKSVNPGLPCSPPFTL